MKTTTKRMIRNGKPKYTVEFGEYVGGEKEIRQFVANALRDARKEGRANIARASLLRGWSFDLTR